MKQKFRDKTYSEIEDYCKQQYGKIKRKEFLEAKSWDKENGRNKKLTLREVVKSHKEYLWKIASLDKTAKWIGEKYGVEISRYTLGRYYNSLELPTHLSKKQRKHKQRKKTTPDEEISNHCIIIDDSNYTIFPVSHKSRGIIVDRKEKKILTLVDNETDKFLNIPINTKEKSKKTVVKEIVRRILLETTKEVALDGELLNSNDSIFGSNRVKRYECKYIAEKTGDKTPLSKYYQKGESKHLNVKESVYNLISSAKEWDKSEAELLRDKEKWLEIYQQNLDTMEDLDKVIHT